MKKRPKILSPRWEEIFASLGDGLIVIDDQRSLLAMNPSAEGITGLSAEGILGHPIQEAFLNNQKLLDLLEDSFKAGTALTLREVPWQKNRGEKGAIDLTTTPLMNEEGGLSGWILLFRDLSPMKSLEEQVRKSDPPNRSFRRKKD
ncbi:MAG: PAS domain S-box protein [Deltaproteobacteria bacterium]|nr:PAS domain S-box protein [Deltaproteobacteria bacterium]